MKRIITLLLAMVMTLSLCACAGSGDAQQTDAAKTEGLQVGYAKIDITPTYEVGLHGYGDTAKRASQGFLDYIYSTCIAVTSGEETVLIYTIDNVGINHESAEKIRDEVTEATGIAGEKIFIGATHGHNCPALTNAYSNYDKYMTDFLAGTVESAKKALEDRSAATFSSAKMDHEKMNAVRHYTLDDGTNVDSSTASTVAAYKLVGHPMETDPQMIMLKFDRADESKKDILMVNWQAHPDDAKEIGYNQISPGFIGPMRNKLEKETGMHVAYFTGAAGNLVHSSRISSENKANYSYSEYGEALADCALSMIEKLEPVEGTAVKTSRYLMTVEVDHSLDHMLSQANEVYDMSKNVGSDAAAALAETYGISGSLHASAIRRRASMGKTDDMEMNVFSIGDIGFTTGTYEMFSTNAMFVKENSPFETTFVICGCNSYIAADIAYTYPSYEALTGNYVRGTGEQLADQYVKMLGEIKQ